jgi:uncharacterized membrane protein YeaQ/YmgE (transglycosylase-associated protein family)
MPDLDNVPLDGKTAPEDKPGDKSAPVAGQGGASAPLKPGAKKPNFNKPFIVCGILLGLASGLPFVNLLNLLLFAWAWIFGFLAARMLSKEYPYMQPMHGAVVGVFTGAIGALIGSILISAWSVGGYFLFDGILPGEPPEQWRYLYPPGQVYCLGIEFGGDNLLNWLFKPYPAKIADRIYIDLTAENVRDGIGLTIFLNFLIMEVSHWLFAGVGGFIGGVLWSKPLPIKKEQPRRKTAGAGGLDGAVGAAPKAKPVVYARPVLEDGGVPKAKVLKAKPVDGAPVGPADLEEPEDRGVTTEPVEEPLQEAVSDEPPPAGENKDWEDEE